MLRRIWRHHVIDNVFLSPKILFIKKKNNQPENIMNIKFLQLISLADGQGDKKKWANIIRWIINQSQFTGFKYVYIFFLV